MFTNQDDKTKKFIEEAKNVVDRGIEPSYKAIADKIGWHNNSLSMALNGKRNIPFDIYKKFAEIYKPLTEQKPEVKDEGWKEKYMALLEEHLEIKKALFKELNDFREDMDEFKQSHEITRKELAELKQNQLATAALQLSFQEHWLSHFYDDEDKISGLRKSIGQKAFESLLKMMQEGIEVGSGIRDSQ